MSPGGVEERDYFRLRAEWLRLKNQVFDVNSQLPTLAAVLDDVRRLVEERGVVGLIYMDLGAVSKGEAAHGWFAHDEILRGFGQALLGLKRDGFTGARDIVAVMGVRSDKFVLVVTNAGPSFLDEENLGALARSVRARVLETVFGHLKDTPLLPVSFHDGHALLQRDPTVRAERALHSALDRAMMMSLRLRNREEDERALELDALVREGRVETLYQPIMDLRDLTMVGHEVFSRGPTGSPFEDAETLFLFAERTGRLLDFERLCRTRALASARLHLREGGKLFINTTAAALLDPQLAGERFLREVKSYGLSPGDVVLEITERMAVEERGASTSALKALKRFGFRVAIDDMGAGYSSLHSVVEMEPDFTKFDVSLVRHIDRSLIKQSLLETLVELSAKIGAQVIAEGIESEAELTALRDMGVFLGQGRHLAPPAPVGI